MSGREQIPFLLNKSSLIGAEVGVETGLFSEYLLKTGLFKVLYSIDPWPKKIPGVFIDDEQFFAENNEETYQTAKERLGAYKESVIIRDYSAAAAKHFEDDSLDFVFLDGDHTKEGVKTDLSCWYPKVKPGGILSGHDYMDHVMDCGYGIKSFFGVKTAVDSFFKDIGTPVIAVEEKELNKLNWLQNKEDFTSWYSWYIIK